MIRARIHNALAFVLLSTAISLGMDSAFVAVVASAQPIAAASTDADTPATRPAGSVSEPKNPSQDSPVTSIDDSPGAELKVLQEILEKLKKPPELPQKDYWDRFAAVSTFISTVIVALIGLYFTQSYNRAEARRRQLQEARQNQINELDVIAKFMPYLTGSDEGAKVTAITTIRALAGVQLATVMAELHPSTGTAKALEVIAQSTRTTPEERVIAETAANKIYDTLAGVSVLFATDRQVSPGTPPRYDTSRSELSFGRGLVTVPKSHRLGSIERPSLWRFELSVDPNRHLVLQELVALEATAFFGGLEDMLAVSANRDVLILIPGYNVDFETAMLRLAQLSYDMALGLPAILFSWPSQGSAAAYLIDQANAVYAVPHLTSVLRDLATVPHIGSLHILAHGIGCQLAVDAVVNLQASGVSSLAKNLILVSPDVDRASLTASTPRVKQVVDRLTIYVRKDDTVLQMATKLAGSPRAGDASGGIVVFPSADTIDATAADSSLVGHSYYVGGSVLYDISSLLRDGSPPERRFNLRPASASGKTYWIYGYG